MNEVWYVGRYVISNFHLYVPIYRLTNTSPVRINLSRFEMLFRNTQFGHLHKYRSNMQINKIIHSMVIKSFKDDCCSGIDHQSFKWKKRALSVVYPLQYGFMLLSNNILMIKGFLYSSSEFRVKIKMRFEPKKRVSCKKKAIFPSKKEIWK